MVDILLANKFSVSISRINKCYDIFDYLVCSKQIKYHKLLDTDKIILNKLLDNNEDNTKYDYPLQKIYVYMIIFFSNFISEGILLDLDDEYIDIIIQVLLNTNITRELFKLL